MELVIAKRYSNLYQQIQHPTRTEFDRYYVYQKGSVVINGDSIRAVIDYFGGISLAEIRKQGFLIEKDTDESAYADAMRILRLANQAIDKQFEGDLCEAYGVSGPRANQLFRICLETSETVFETEVMFERFAPLLR